MTKRAVKLTVAYKLLNAGEVGGFEAEEAATLVARGNAVYVDGPKTPAPEVSAPLETKPKGKK